jgi:hypothetical protein
MPKVPKIEKLENQTRKKNNCIKSEERPKVENRKNKHENTK